MGDVGVPKVARKQLTTCVPFTLQTDKLHDKFVAQENAKRREVRTTTVAHHYLVLGLGVILRGVAFLDWKRASSVWLRLLVHASVSVS